MVWKTEERQISTLSGRLVGKIICFYLSVGLGQTFWIFCLPISFGLKWLGDHFASYWLSTQSVSPEILFETKSAVRFLLTRSRGVLPLFLRVAFWLLNWWESPLAVSATLLFGSHAAVFPKQALACLWNQSGRPVGTQSYCLTFARSGFVVPARCLGKHFLVLSAERWCSAGFRAILWFSCDFNTWK